MLDVHVRNVTWTLATGYVSFSFRYIYCFVAIGAFHIFRNIVQDNNGMVGMEMVGMEMIGMEMEF